jgi:hypothetical protein
MFVGERISFLKLAGVVDRTAGDEFTGVTTGEPLKGELLRDLMSMRGFGGKLRPEAFDVALPGLRGWTREASGASSSEELSEESEVSSLLAGGFLAGLTGAVCTVDREVALVWMAAGRAGA